MAEYINRHEALTIEDLSIECGPDEIDLIMRGMALYAEHIKSLPVVPVEPVVRCKDCGYWDTETIRQNSNDAGWWNEAICVRLSRYGNEPYEAWTDADWFCADGERKGGEGDV